MTQAGDLTVRKGAWSHEEDLLLKRYIEAHGEGRWSNVPSLAGLRRCRKSCRLRWLNYLQPNIKRGNFADDEIDIILRLHKLLGNRWSLIAGRIPGRTANDIKNYWNSYLSKKASIKQKEKTKKMKKKKLPNQLAIMPNIHDVTKVVEKRTCEVIKPQPQIIKSNIQWFAPKVDGKLQVGGDLPQPTMLMTDQQIPSIEVDDNFWEKLYEGAIDI